MDKLTFNQVGKIAFYVERAIKLFPNDKESEEGIFVEKNFKEPWEENLEKWINADPTLPKYDLLPSEILGALINYYAASK